MYTLSLVVPCYNEEETIPIFYDTVLTIAPQIDAELEFVFVDDGSTDRTLAILRDLSKKDARVHYVSFSRNFGKESALYAGLKASHGDYVATMDVDLQDPPSLLPQMLSIVTGKTETDGIEYDCVATRRSTRKGEPPIRSFFANLFYRLINKMSTVKIENGARDYRLMSRTMVNAIINDPEYNRFSKGIFSWVGFNTYWIAYENIERSAGTTKWSFFKLFKYSLEGILAYTTVPLLFSSLIGLFFCIASLLGLLFIVIRKLLRGDPVAGWASMVSIITFLGGIILFNLGILGLYISKMYMETKNRQIYIVREEK
ncbi:MAG: glycosyltransferase family 2 protein [Treponema sp.]|nr:glycosyltransferase family 2 protein [Treponema sp.]